MGRLNSFLKVSATWVSNKESSPNSRKLKEGSDISIPAADKTSWIFSSSLLSLEDTSRMLSFVFIFPLMTVLSAGGNEGLVVAIASDKAGASTQYLLLL